MATIKEVTTLDIQLQDASREGTTTIKLDNPKSDITREKVSSALQTAFANEWFISARNGKSLIFLGDVIKSQSIKTTLDGEDFYVTPSSASALPTTITVSGAFIQGYNIKNLNQVQNINVTISENGLSATVNGVPTAGNTGSFNLILIIQGQEITVPFTNI